MSIIESDRAAILVCWRLRNWGEYKIPVGRGGGHPHAFNRISPTHGILYSPQFRSHQETKMAARQTQLYISTISQENRGLWTVYGSLKVHLANPQFFFR